MNAEIKSAVDKYFELNKHTQLLFGKIQPICLVLPDTEEWRLRADKGIAHFKENDVHPFYVSGVHAVNFGITSTMRYQADTWGRIYHECQGKMPQTMPDTLKQPYYFGDGKIGGLMSHYMIYNIMAAMTHDYYLVLEDDCRFREGWKEKLQHALQDAPSDFDFLFTGSSDAENKEPAHIKGDVWHFPNRLGKETWFPQTGFCYIISKKCLALIIATQRSTWAPVDVLLIYEAFKHLNIYAVLSRLADQENTHLNP